MMTSFFCLFFWLNVDMEVKGNVKFVEQKELLIILKLPSVLNTNIAWQFFFFLLNKRDHLHIVKPFALPFDKCDIVSHFDDPF